jgi:molecular chaperone GrpE
MEKKEKEKKSRKIIKTKDDPLTIEKNRSKELSERLKYLQADFENLNKRFTKQLEEVKKYSNEGIIIKLLEIVDELELAIKVGKTSNSNIELIHGVEMVLKKLTKVLQSERVYPIECIGKPLDPIRHNVIAKIEKKNVKGNIIVEELRKGYIMREKVIRPSIVKVAVEIEKTKR